MARILFDVNDGALRDRFLRTMLDDLLAALGAEARPVWGTMTAQQMVEHLAWGFELSTGRTPIECPLPEARREALKNFLYDNRPTPRGFMNPVLAAGLPALRHASLAEAKASLRIEVNRFLACAAADPGAVRTHPVFGPITMEGWARSHFKHAYHHLCQFALIGGE